LVVTIPPSPVVTDLRGWNEKAAASPRPPAGTPWYEAPAAQAASSIIATPAGTDDRIASMSAQRPNRWTAITALVRSVTFRATSAGSTL
jgi:hypothetical protein